MRFQELNRTRKIKILSRLFDGETAPLINVRKPPSQDLSTWTDEELKAEHERLRQKEYRETGVLRPPMPDFAAMSDEELQSYRDVYLKASPYRI